MSIGLLHCQEVFLKAEISYCGGYWMAHAYQKRLMIASNINTTINAHFLLNIIIYPWHTPFRVNDYNSTHLELYTLVR